MLKCLLTPLSCFKKGKTKPFPCLLQLQFHGFLNVMSTQVTVAFHWLFPLSLTSFGPENVLHFIFSHNIKFCPKKNPETNKDRILINGLFVMNFCRGRDECNK